MDDGTSFEYRDGKHILVGYFFRDWTLSVAKIKGDGFDGAKIVSIAEIAIYLEEPLQHCPMSIYEHFSGATAPEAYPIDAKKDKRLSYKCSSDLLSIVVTGLSTPVDFGMSPDTKYDLLKI